LSQLNYLERITEDKEGTRKRNREGEINKKRRNDKSVRVYYLCVTVSDYFLGLFSTSQFFNLQFY
jgi:hypothetical protein